MKPEQQKTFDKFWKEHWPKCRRVGKKQAADQWARIPESLYETIYAAVERQKKQPAWNTGDCKYIPHPFRWLRNRRWEDEVSLPEDHDADILIEKLANNNVMPHDLPAKIAMRFRKMCMRLKTNWPELYLYVTRMEEEAHAYIRKEFLSTQE